MASGDGVTRPPQIFGQVQFHPHRGLERHRVEVSIMLGQQPNAVALYNGCGFNAILVIGETLFWRQASHANVNTRFVGISIGIGSPDMTQLANRRVQKHDVNVVMMRIGAGRAQLSKRAALQPANLTQSHNRKGALGGPGFQDATSLFNTPKSPEAMIESRDSKVPA
jgi:hypothetical protein